MCDTLCALGKASAEPGAVLAKNSDRPLHEVQPLQRSAPRREDRTRTTYLSVEGAPADTIGVLGTGPAWMWGLEQGLNEAGVAMGNQRLWTDDDPRGHPDALTGMDLVRLGLERGATAEEAVTVVLDLLERHGQGGACHEHGWSPYWSSFLVADRSQAFVVETSGTDHAVEQVAPGQGRAISNRLTIEGFDARHHLDSGGVIEGRVDPRLAASRDVLAGAPLDVARAKAHLRSHVGAPDGFTICMHVGDERTTASMVAVLDGDRSRAWFLLGSPCRSLYMPLWPGQETGPALAWERFAGLDDEQGRALQALEPELDAQASSDPRWPEEAWRQVDAALLRLGA